MEVENIDLQRDCLELKEKVVLLEKENKQLKSYDDNWKEYNGDGWDTVSLNWTDSKTKRIWAIILFVVIGFIYIGSASDDSDCNAILKIGSYLIAMYSFWMAGLLLEGDKMKYWEKKKVTVALHLYAGILLYLIANFTIAKIFIFFLNN